MKANKVFSVIFAIALFAAFVGMITCLYNAIDMFVYTTFSPEQYYSTNPYESVNSYNQLQKPLAIILLVASIISLLGVIAAGLWLFSKKDKVKRIAVVISIIVVVAFIAFLISACSVWFSYMQGKVTYIAYSSSYKYEILSFKPYYISSGYTTEYTLYSAVMSALLPQLIYFAVIAGIIVYFFVSPIIKAKRNKNAQTLAKCTETESAENENAEESNIQNI